MATSGSRAQLRETIARAAIPLIADWEAVTTAQIAGAAGVDEAALLDVFEDKDAALFAALQSVLMAAIDPTDVVRELESIALDRPLAARLVAAVEALDSYHGRLITALGPLEGVRPAGKPGREFDREDFFGGAARMDVISAATTKLLAPDQESLRLPAGTLADAFLGLYSGRKRTVHAAPLPAGQLVDLFLHGVLTPTDPA
jgi:AcrR family transcriptional regulator